MTLVFDTNVLFAAFITDGLCPGGRRVLCGQQPHFVQSLSWIGGVCSCLALDERALLVGEAVEAEDVGRHINFSVVSALPPYAESTLVVSSPYWLTTRTATFWPLFMGNVRLLWP